MPTTKPKISERPGLDLLIADGIREKIMAGALACGEHLVEAEFAREFDVSHGTVRSAFKALQAEGLVEYRPRRGMFVVTLEPDDVLELCSLRDSLEALGARLAAQNATEADGKRLHKLLRNIKSAALRGDRRACMELDIALHRLVIDMSRHKRLQQMYGQLEFQVRLFMILTESFHPGLTDMSTIHEPLVNAIVAGDGDLAALASSGHNKSDGEALANALRHRDRRASA
jgi:DNA-binding GntR family transcriptional regulator